MMAYSPDVSIEKVIRLFPMVTDYDMLYTVCGSQEIAFFLDAFDALHCDHLPITSTVQYSLFGKRS